MDADRVADIVLSEVGKLPAGSWALSYDGPRRIDDPYSDYLVEREICIEPAESAGCPIEVWITSAGAIGLGFDTWQRLAARVGATSSSSRFVFGLEPIELRETSIRSALHAVLMGRAEARYRASNDTRWGPPS